MTAGNLDIRIPIGLLFAVLGGLLGAYGLVSDAAIDRRSLDINLNLWWGLAMFVFGDIMFALGRRKSRHHAPEAPSPSGMTPN